MIERRQLLNLIEAARLAGRPDYASAAAADWLAAWPGDGEVQFRLAQSEIEQGMNAPAAARLTRVVTVDPEYIEAYDLLATALRAQGDSSQAQIFGSCAVVLRGGELDRWKTPSWAFGLARALKALASADNHSAMHEAQTALSADPSTPLPTVVTVRAHLASGDRQSAAALARAGHDRWPECALFLLVLARHLLEQGDTPRGVDYLHRAAAEDPTGRIASTVLGTDHPYRRLWPEAMASQLSHPIPAEVAALQGENRLAAAPAGAAVGSPAGANSNARPETDPASLAATRPSAPHATSEPASDDDLPQPEPWEAFRGPNSGETPADPKGDLDEVREGLNRVAARLKSPRRTRDEDDRLPAYIALSSRSRLTQEFGEAVFRKIDEAAMKLVETIRRRPGWSAYRLYVDDPVTLQPFGLSPADPQNAWQIKLRLADLDRALRRRGEMIGALLIIGGDRIVPFHQLPNPTDDDDESIPSDNPYAATDENYFAPEWPIGRLPWDTNPEELLYALEAASQSHRSVDDPGGPVRRLQLWLHYRFGRLVGRQARALGYTASIWRKSSLAVYRAIGDAGSLLTSPPTEAGRLPSQAIRPTRLSYYNLHGLEDSPEWFGQRDPMLDDQNDTEFPIALRPEDVVNSGRAPLVVFTEACYGANALAKTSQSAMSLKFLASGSLAVIGSTKTSYGAIAPPLIAADLLGRLFWDGWNRGLPVGEALRRAKLGLAAEMHRRQGYLDGEDQKTLIAFVLYGDPLITLSARDRRGKEKAILRRTSRPANMKTACALGGPEIASDALDPRTAERIRSIVAHYLPGMTSAQCRIRTQQPGCEGEGHACPTHQLGIKAGPGASAQTLQVTLSKEVIDGSRRHPHVARLTMDANGKILKLAVSK